MGNDSHTIDALYDVIVSRKGADPETSYTARLFHQGRPEIAKKLGEEAAELMVASLSQGRSEVISESADVLYHLSVLWAEQGVTPADVWAELNRREGTSGIKEKNSRTTD